MTSLISKMIPQIFSTTFTILMTSFVFMLCFTKLLKYWTKSRDKTHGLNKLPPGPPKLPVLGNLLQLIGPSSLPYINLANLTKKYGSIMHLQLGKTCTIVISSPEAAKEVLKTKEISFAQRPNFSPTANRGLVLSAYGDYWRKIRKICVLELLSTSRVNSFKSIREDEVSRFIDFISSNEGRPINLTHKIQSMAENLISKAAFGKQCHTKDELFQYIKKMARLAPLVTLSSYYPRLRFLLYFLEITLKRYQRRAKKIVHDILNEHKLKLNSQTPVNQNIKLHNQRPNDHVSNLVDILLSLQESDDIELHLKSKDIEDVILDVFGAGSETTSSAIIWAISELIKNPRVMEKVQAEVRQKFSSKTKIEEKDIQDLHYLKLVIKETLRLHPAGLLLPREARVDTEINGYQIPANSVILINLLSMVRDPNVWVDPDCFRPERFDDVTGFDFEGTTNYEYIPFGSGRRVCPGISFSTPVIELTLAQMMYHFDWQIPSTSKDAGFDMTESFRITVQRKQNLCLIPTVRVPFL